MCFSIDQCITSGIHIFTFANSSRNIPLNISFFIHFLYTFCVRFKAKATAGFDIRGLKCPEFLAMIQSQNPVLGTNFIRGRHRPKIQTLTMLLYTIFGWMAQLVERCTGIAEVMGSNPVQA